MNCYPVIVNRHFFFGIFCLFLILFTFFLGFWQLERLKMKEALLSKMYATVQKPPLTLDEATEKMTSLDEMVYRRIVFDGVFLPKTQTTISLCLHQGKAGYETVVAVKLKNGATVFVNLGWSVYPLNINYPKSWVKIEGIVQKNPTAHSFFDVANNPGKKQWHRVDVPALTQHFALIMGLSFYITLRKIQPPVEIAFKEGGEQPPKPAVLSLKDPLPFIPNNHLIYAITWFVLALCLLCSAVFYFYRHVCMHSTFENIEGKQQY